MDCGACEPGELTAHSPASGHIPNAPPPPVMLWRWLGVTWYGMPKPVRWWKRARHQPGCGCVKVLKDAWNAVRVAVRPASIRLALTPRPVPTRIVGRPGEKQTWSVAKDVTAARQNVA